MKLKSEFVTYPVDDKIVLIGTGKSNFKGMMKANATAGFILSCLHEEVTEQDIVESILDKYDADREKVTEDVKRILSALRSVGALDE